MQRVKSERSPFFPIGKKRESSSPRGGGFPVPESWKWRGREGRESDYRLSSLTPLQLLSWGLAGILLSALLAALFYRSVLAFLILAPAGAIFLPYRMRAVLAARRREALSRQFRDGILAVVSALNAGYAIENAWREAAAEMAVVYGEQGEITREFRGISRKLTMGQTAEEAVRSLAERSGIAEIRQFAEVFAAAKRTSGNLAPILTETADLLAKKLRLQEEIRTMVTAKRLEQNIMNGMPVLILIYINLGSPGFTDPLYKTLAGRLIMTVCLGAYGFAVWLGQKILQVEV